MDWQGRVAVVTGGASGIGAATAWEFAREGASVAVLDVNADGAGGLVEQLVGAGHVACSIAVDVSDAGACRAAVGGVLARLGRVDFLVNSAACFTAKGLDATPEDWERVLGVNVRGCANMAQACWEPMRQVGGGAIVNIASISAHVAHRGYWTYNTSKAALLALTRCQALDLAPHGIRANVVSPGCVWTPEVAKEANGDRAKWEPVWGRYHMLGRIGEPREVARAILFLCSDDASFITGTELVVDGGYLGLGADGAAE